MANWMSGRKAAKALGVSHTTLHRWVKVGKVQPLGEVDGSTLVFDRDYVQRLAEQLNAQRSAKRAVA